MLELRCRDNSGHAWFKRLAVLFAVILCKHGSSQVAEAYVAPSAVVKDFDLFSDG
jgi:hypothetical protein